MIRVIKWLPLCLTIVVLLFVSACSEPLQVQEPPDKMQGFSVPALQKIKLALWDDYEYDRQIVNGFLRQNPAMCVEVVAIPGPEYENKLTIMLASGENIDVFYAKTLILYSNLILKDHVLPLNDFVKKDIEDFSPYGSMLEAMKVDGMFYGLPYRNDTFIVLYNKDIFDREGLPYPSGDWFWADYAKIAERLTSWQMRYKVFGAQNVPVPEYYLIPGMQKQKGSSLITSDLKLLKPGLELFLRMEQEDKSSLDYGTAKALNTDQTLFEKGTIGMTIGGTWMPYILAADKKAGKFTFNWGIAKLPRWKDGEDQTPMAPIAACINARTASPHAAWEFVRFAAAKEGAKILVQHRMLPGYVDEEIISLYNSNADLPEGSSNVLRRDKTYLNAPPSRIMGLINKMIHDETELILTRNKTVDQGIADMMKQREEIINRNK